MNITPTLVIGLGGTGKDTVLLLRKRLYESYQMIDGCLGLPSVQFLVIDTDKQVADTNAGGNNQIPPQAALNSDTFLKLEISEGEFNNYANQPEAYPAISSWLTNGLLNKLGPDIVKQGAGQHRQIGRLFFFHSIDTIKNAINSKLQFLDRKMKNYDNWEGRSKLRNLPKSYEQELNVYIITSLSGGTGCGMFIDTAMLTKKIINSEAYSHYRIPKINMICLMPPINIGSSESKYGGPGHVRANAFAALKEVEYISSISQDLNPLDYPDREHNFNVEWRKNQDNIKTEDSYNLKETKKPWSTFYLIDDTNLNNKTNSGYKSSVDMVAERLYMEMDNSDLPNRLNQLYSNIIGETREPKEIQININNPTSPNQTRIITKKINVGYASFGLASYRFDRDKQRNLASQVLSKMILDYWLKIQNPDDFAIEDRIKTATRLLRPLSAMFEFLDADGNKTALPLELNKLRLLLLSKTPSTIKDHLEFNSEMTIEGTLLDEVRMKVRAAVSLDAEESLEVDPVNLIRALIKEQDLFLAKPDGLNNRSNPDQGKVQNLINKNESTIIDLVPQCLIAVFKKMINECGVIYANQMLDTARDLFQRILLNIQDEPDQISIYDLTRLLDARGIWLFWMRNNASRWELERLKGNLEQNLVTLYLAKTKPATERILKKILSLIGSRAEKRTLKAIIESFEDLVGDGNQNIRSQISEEFNKINGYSSSQDKSTRAVNVFTKMDEVEIGKQVYKYFGGDGYFRRQIELISTDALTEYLNKPFLLGDLVVYLFKPFEDPVIDRPGPIDPNATIFRLMKEALLSTALKKLENFKDDENITQYLQRDDLERRVSDLASYSAPYILRRNNDAIENFCRRFDQVLAYAQSNNGESNLNIDAALHKVPNLSVPIYPPGNTDKMLGKVTMDDDAVVLYQQAAGFPLNNSSKVYLWGEDYDARSSIRYEFHIDKFFCMNAPEIRSDFYLSDRDKYLDIIVECLKGVLFGHLRSEFSSGSANVQGAVGEVDYLFTNHLGQNIVLPISWDRLMEHLLSPSQAMHTLCSDLKRMNSDWFANIQVMSDISEKQNKLFKLWFALYYVWFDIRENSKGGVDHPLQKMISQIVLPELMKNIIYKNLIIQHHDYASVNNAFDVCKTKSSSYTFKKLLLDKVADTNSSFQYQHALEAMDLIVQMSKKLLNEPNIIMKQNPNFVPIWTIK
jgi:hypothetical protein